MNLATTRGYFRSARRYSLSALVLALGASLQTPAHGQAPQQSQVVRLSANAWQPASASRAHRTRFQTQASLSDGLPALPTSSTSSSADVPPSLPPQLPPIQGLASEQQGPSAAAPQPAFGGLQDDVPGIPSPTPRSQGNVGGFQPQQAPPPEFAAGGNANIPPPAASSLGASAPAGSAPPPIGYGNQSLPDTRPQSAGPDRLSAATPPTSSLPSSSLPGSSMPSSSMPTMNNTGSQPVSPSVSAAAFNANGSQLRTQRDSGLDARQPTSRQPNSFSQASQTRTIPASQVATGAPFVSQPRRGNYATVPYNPALFQHTLYERVQPQNSLAGFARPSGVGSQLRPQDSVASNRQPNSANQAVRGQLASTPVLQNVGQQSVAGRQAAPGFHPTAFQQCAPGASTANIDPAFVPPTLTPNYAPGVYAAGNAGYRPLFSLGQENYNVSLGRGIVGQPTVYVSGQPVRNFFRYLSP